MKLKLTVLILMLGLVLYSQPVFEHSYSESASQAQLDKLGEIYYSMDVVNKQCLIYDMDHMLLKSISLPVPEGYYLEDIQFLSEHLFNDDDQLELVYIYSKYVPTEFSYYYTYEAKLINENGTIILTLPGVGFTDVIETTDLDKKFLAYQYDYAVVPFRTYTHVYGLPETGGPSISEVVLGFDPGNAFPNPATTMISIPASLPEGVRSGSLEIVDMNGRKVLSYPLTESTGQVQLPTRRLASGTYLYQISAGNRKSEAKKIVIR